MLKDYTSYNYKERNLSEVFRELEEKKFNNTIHRKGKKFNFKINKYSSSELNTTHSKLLSPHIIVGVLVLIVVTSLFCKSIFAFSNNHEYESNNNILDIQSIISKNADINKFKEQVTINCNVVCATIYNNNPLLPKGEESVTKEGTLGQEQVTYVRTYENQKLIDETIISKYTLSKPTSQYIDIGTSEFLAKLKVHIGDTIYLEKDSTLKKSASKSSKDITSISKAMDVKLIDLPNEDWCKISYDKKEGYIEASSLTSETLSPEIVDENRKTKILSNVDIDMALNKSSGLTEKDFKKVLTNLSQDKNNIFKDNYKTFYEMDKKYNINGIFLASIAIHESAWGTSTIANDKGNLFGYGAYDSSPYESSYAFNDYSDGIETVAKALAVHYLNENGTKINDDLKAKGSFYNGHTVKDVNIKYASDPEWYSKVFKYMQLLYDKL